MQVGTSPNPTLSPTLSLTLSLSLTLRPNPNPNPHQVGKGRMTNLMEINGFFSKLSSGTRHLGRTPALDPSLILSRTLSRTLSLSLTLTRHGHLVREPRRAAPHRLAALMAAVGLLLLGHRVVSARCAHDACHHSRALPPHRAREHRAPPNANPNPSPNP